MINILRLTAAASLLAIAATADATTVTYSYDLGGVPVAGGSFSYADGLTGVLGYGDLDTFSLTANGATYLLSDVTPLTDYVHFAYDTTAVSFVVDTNSCGFAGCGFQPSLSAINSAGSFGFFFTGAPGGFEEYSTQSFGSFDTISFNVSGGTVPEPATWGLMIAGFGLVGFAARRRRTAVAA